MLIQISASKGDNYVQIELAEIERVIVNTTNENKNELHLKNGTVHLLRSKEAQRIVDAMRKADNEQYRLD